MNYHHVIYIYIYMYIHHLYLYIYIYYIYADDVYKLYKFISCSVLKVHSLLRGKVAKGGLREGDQATRLAGSASGSPTH